MTYYKAVVHYHFKKGKEKEGRKFVEDELLKAAGRCGCYDIEFCQDEKDGCHYVGMGKWDNLNDWKKFHEFWTVNEEHLMKLCEHRPHRDVYKVETKTNKKGKKAA